MPNPDPIQRQQVTKRFMVATPVTGLVRIEWVHGRYHQVIPCNWSQVEMYEFVRTEAPYRSLVADARNIVCQSFLEQEFEWLFFVDHDVVLHPTTIVQWNRRMLEGDIPVWCGLYFTKSRPSEPLVYRGRGNGFYNRWKLGDLVWVDGIPMGCTVIHRSIIRTMYDESEEYEVKPGIKVRRVFTSPRDAWFDPDTNTFNTSGGTEDLWWCTRVMRDGIFRKAGWPQYQRRKYPFLIDTNVFCRHIDWSGVQYPAFGEEKEFTRREATHG